MVDGGWHVGMIDGGWWMVSGECLVGGGADDVAGHPHGAKVLVRPREAGRVRPETVCCARERRTEEEILGGGIFVDVTHRTV